MYKIIKNVLALILMSVIQSNYVLAASKQKINIEVGPYNANATFVSVGQGILKIFIS